MVDVAEMGPLGVLILLLAVVAFVGAGGWLLARVIYWWIVERE